MICSRQVCVLNLIDDMVWFPEVAETWIEKFELIDSRKFDAIRTCFCQRCDTILYGGLQKQTSTQEYDLIRLGIPSRYAGTQRVSG